MCLHLSLSYTGFNLWLVDIIISPKIMFIRKVCPQHDKFRKLSLTISQDLNCENRVSLKKKPAYVKWMQQQNQASQPFFFLCLKTVQLPWPILQILHW